MSESMESGEKDMGKFHRIIEIQDRKKIILAKSTKPKLDEKK